MYSCLRQPLEQRIDLSRSRSEDHKKWIQIEIRVALLKFAVVFPLKSRLELLFGGHSDAGKGSVNTYLAES